MTVPFLPRRPAQRPLHEAHPRQAGAIGGLSDTALAVVVGTLTLVGVVGFFQTSSSGAKTNAELANFTSLVSNIRSAYWQAGSSYDSISAANLATSRIAPQPLIRTNALRSMFGNSVNVAPTGSSPASQFTVTYVDLPRDACVKMVTTTSNTLTDIVSIQVATDTARTTFPVSVPDASTDCNEDKQNVTWTLR